MQDSDEISNILFKLVFAAELLIGIEVIRIPISCGEETVIEILNKLGSNTKKVKCVKLKE